MRAEEGHLKVRPNAELLSGTKLFGYWSESLDVCKKGFPRFSA